MRNTIIILAVILLAGFSYLAYSISVLSPANLANYTVSAPNLSVTTPELSTIIYSWDGTGNITGCLNCTSYNSTYGEFTPDSDTRLLLHFNENYGAIARDQTGINNGTINGANWTTGRFGYGLKFDGTNKSVVLSAGINPPDNFTIEVWVDATGNDSQMTIVDKYEPNGSYSNGYSLFLNDGIPTFWVSNSNDQSQGGVSINSDIRNTGWHYIAGVYNGTYITVVLDTTSNTASFDHPGVTASSVNLTIGNRANATWYFNGTIDEVRILNRSINDSELAANRNRRLADGAHTLEAYSINASGNTNYTYVTFNTDAAAPFCAFLRSDNTYFRNGTPLNFTAFCNDSATYVTSVYLNVSALGGGIVQMASLGSGNYTYSLYASNSLSENLNVSIYNVTDAYGNANHSYPILSLTADNMNPAVLLDPSLNQTWKNGTIDIAYNATDTQTISACLWRWQNSSGAWASYTSTQCGWGNFSFNTANCYDNASYACRVELFANDSAGNSNSSLLAFRIDNSPPNLSQVSPANNSVAYSNLTAISFNITDTASGVNLSTLLVNDTTTAYNLTNMSCTSISTGYSCSLSLAQNDGLRSITISAYDNLSNYAQTTIYYTVAGCQYPSSGNWEINYTQSCTNRTIVLTGNLTVQSGGNLTLRNTTLLLNGTYNGSRKIEVQGGALYILDNDGVQATPDGSNITALNTSNRFLFIVGSGSTFEMRNSHLSYAGYATDYPGLYLSVARAYLSGNTLSNTYTAISGSTENSTFENNTITSSTNGMVLHSAGSTFRRNRITGMGADGILLTGSRNNLLSYNNLSSNGNAGLQLNASSNNTASNNTFALNNAGVVLFHSGNDSVQNNSIASNNIGVNATGANQNTIIGRNSISSNQIGILANSSAGMLLVGNTISASNQSGIRLAYATSVVIANNTINSTAIDGVFFQSSSTNVISGNMAINSGRAGIALNYSMDNNLSGGSFYGAQYGLYLGGATGNLLSSATFSSGTGGYDLYSNTSSSNTLLNSSYNYSKAYFEDSSSRIYRQWYVRMTVVNESYAPLNNTNVTILDNSSSTVFSAISGSDGVVLAAVTEALVSTNTINYTPHRILANVSGFFGNTTLIVNESRNLTLVLADVTPPQALSYSFEPQYIYPNGTTTFRAHIWENTAISQASLAISTPNGTYNYTLSYQSSNSTGQTWSVQITNTSLTWLYNATSLYLNDTKGNNNTIPLSAYFRVQNDLPPNVTAIESNTSITEVNSSLLVNASITDDYNVTAAYLSILSPESSRNAMSFVSGNGTLSLWQILYTPARNGTYFYRIEAEDNSSNTAYSAQRTFNSTHYNCTSAGRLSDQTNCMAVGCLWSIGASGACSSYNHSEERNLFDLALSANYTYIYLASRDTTGRITSSTARNAFLNISINNLTAILPVFINSTSPREIGVLTNGFAISPRNSTILALNYSNYKFSAAMNGSGNDSVVLYTSTFGTPESIKLDGTSQSFVYNATSKIAELNVTLGSPHTLEVQFTQPCAPLGGVCGTCCSGTCCLGVCTSTCAQSQETQQSSQQGSVSVKSASLYSAISSLETMVGVPVSFLITAKNTGTDNLTTMTLEFTNITKGWVSVLPPYYNLPVGAQTDFNVTIIPMFDGRYNVTVYVPNPRSQSLRIALTVKSGYTLTPEQTENPAQEATPTATSQPNNTEELNLLIAQLSQNVTIAKNKGANTTAIEQILENARNLLAQGDNQQAQMLINYASTELSNIKVAVAEGSPANVTGYLAVAAFLLGGAAAFRYKDRIFHKKEGSDEAPPQKPEENPEQTSMLVKILDLKQKVSDIDAEIGREDMQKAIAMYESVQEGYEDLRTRSEDADEETRRALNELYVSLDRVYEEMSRHG